MPIHAQADMPVDPSLVLVQEGALRANNPITPWRTSFLSTIDLGQDRTVNRTVRTTNRGSAIAKRRRGATRGRFEPPRQGKANRSPVGEPLRQPLRRAGARADIGIAAVLDRPNLAVRRRNVQEPLRTASFRSPQAITREPTRGAAEPAHVAAGRAGWRRGLKCSIAASVRLLFSQVTPGRYQQTDQSVQKMAPIALADPEPPANHQNRRRAQKLRDIDSPGFC